MRKILTEQRQNSDLKVLYEILDKLITSKQYITGISYKLHVFSMATSTGF